MHHEIDLNLAIFLANKETHGEPVADLGVARDAPPFHFNFFHEVFSKKYAKQECVPVGCILTSAMVTTRCQY